MKERSTDPPDSQWRLGPTSRLEEPQTDSAWRMAVVGRPIPGLWMSQFLWLRHSPAHGSHARIPRRRTPRSFLTLPSLRWRCVLATAWFGPCPHCRTRLSYLEGVSGSTTTPKCPSCRQVVEVKRATFLMADRSHPAPTSPPPKRFVLKA